METNNLRFSSLVTEITRQRGEGILPPNTILGYESAAYLLGFGMELTCPITPRDSEGLGEEDLLYIADTDVRYTSALQTFCDLLNREEFITGEVYEICANIYEHYGSPDNNLGGTEELYRLASQYVSREILDANWEELHEFYNYD